jgi:hypothetical protein
MITISAFVSIDVGDFRGFDSNKGSLSAVENDKESGLHPLIFFLCLG